MVKPGAAVLAELRVVGPHPLNGVVDTQARTGDAPYLVLMAPAKPTRFWVPLRRHALRA